MAICSSGVSQPKAGVNTSVFVDQAYIQSLLPTGLAWVYPYLPYMHGLEIGDVAAFCAADPPTWTVPSGGDILEFLTGGPFGSYLTVEAFLQDITKAYLWYKLCECASVATPAPPSAPSAPSDLPAINPPVAVAPPRVEPCRSYVSPTVAIPNSSSPVIIGTRPSGGTPAAVPAGTTSLVMHLRNIATGGVHATVEFVIRPDDTATHETVGTLYSVPSGTTLNVTTAFPANYYGFTLEVGRASGSPTGVTDLAQANVEAYCGGAQPNQNDSPCCPPDPTLTAALRRLQQTVDLIQRQSTPFSYVYGDNHAGLTGDGEIAVSGLIGVSVDVVAQPSSVGSYAGTPIHLEGVGWLTLGTSDGWLRPRPIDADGALELAPNGSGAVTRIGYSLATGVEVAIRELVREP